MGSKVRDSDRSVVTVGIFDGVHRGHVAVIERTVALAGKLGLPGIALIFEPHPDEFLRPGSHPSRLTSAARRTVLLTELGVDEVVELPFTLALTHASPADFVESVLVKRLRAAAVVVGEGFRFGAEASGDLEVLRALGAEHGFTVEAVPSVAGVSAAGVREALAAGDVKAAAEALGRPHRVEGVVVRGFQRGRRLGFPTANVETPSHTAIPADGVYAGWLQCVRVGNLPAAYCGVRWPAAISVGTNPTFEGVPRTVEAYALDRDDLELYGTHVAVEFADRLRGNTRFDSIEALVEQINADVNASRRITAG